VKSPFSSVLNLRKSAGERFVGPSSSHPRQSALICGKVFVRD